MHKILKGSLRILRDKFNVPYIGVQYIFQCGVGFFNTAFILFPAENENLMHS